LIELRLGETMSVARDNRRFSRIHGLRDAIRRSCNDASEEKWQYDYTQRRAQFSEIFHD
jgi:hypothetical protein